MTVLKAQARERVAPPWYTEAVLIHKHAAFAYVYMSGRTESIGRMTAPPANRHLSVVTWVVHKGEWMEGWGKGWRGEERKAVMSFVGL